MIEELRKCAGNTILEWLLLHPTTPVSINELARTLAVSPATVLRYIRSMEESGLVITRAAGTAHLITLNRESPLARPLRAGAILLVVWDAGISRVAPGAISVALYGSMASGTFDEKSDIDLLVLGTDADVDHDLLLRIETATGHVVQLTVLPWPGFETLKKDHDPFIESVLANHVMIRGAAL
jgi:uncharacterized protein